MAGIGMSWSCWTRVVLMASVAVACGPVVTTNDGAEGAGSESGAESAESGATSSSPGCTETMEQACRCPDMRMGTRYCQPNGEFGACNCPPPSSTGEVSTTGFSASTSGASSESSSSGEPFVPPPCLPLDQPCDGPVRVETNADVIEAAACSRIAGSLVVRSGVTDLSPMACLQELSNQLYVEGVDMPSLAGLSSLRRVEGELEIGWTTLGALDLEALVYVDTLSLYENEELETLGMPNLELIESGFAANDNPLLSTCELEALAENVLGPEALAFYINNLDDGCPSSR